jgi:hypothetical protein
MGKILRSIRWGPNATTPERKAPFDSHTSGRGANAFSSIGNIIKTI